MQTRIPYQRCPLCNSTALQPHATGDCSRHAVYSEQIPAEIRWLQCKTCTHVFTDGYFSDEAAAVIFSKVKENQVFGHDIERQRHASAEIIEQVLPFASAGRWLDVGIGNGSLLFTADEYGFTPVGLDLRQANVEAARRMGIEALVADITSLPATASYRVISMCDVLEHMPFPRDGLAAAHRLLEPGGVLFLSMPNMDSILWKVLNAHKANPYWGEIEHYHNFGRRRLAALLAETGFEVARFSLSKRYRACMELVALKRQGPGSDI